MMPNFQSFSASRWEKKCKPETQVCRLPFQESDKNRKLGPNAAAAFTLTVRKMWNASTDMLHLPFNLMKQGIIDLVQRSQEDTLMVQCFRRYKCGISGDELTATGFNTSLLVFSTMIPVRIIGRDWKVYYIIRM